MSQDTSPRIEPANTIGDGTTVYHVRNTDLAIALVSVGVPLRKDPPYTHQKMKDGTIIWTFNFEECTKDGVLKTAELIKAFGEDMKFLDSNPEHPFTYSLATVKNVASFAEHMASSKPYVGFKSPRGGAVLWVVEGSRKHRNCIAKGMVQV